MDDFQQHTEIFLYVNVKEGRPAHSFLFETHGGAQQQKQMARRKRVFISSHLNDRGGDFSRQWFVEDTYIFPINHKN